MTTTVNVSQNGQLELPEPFLKRRKIAPGTALRVTEVGDGLYITPVPGPTEKELRDVVAAAGSLSRRQSSEDETMVRDLIAGFRKEKHQKR